MFRHGLFGIALGALIAIPAQADPTGEYRVTLTQPGGDVQAGRATVTRIDEGYRIVWTLDGRSTVGIALGGAFNRGDLVVGPAHQDDVLLAIGFRDGDSYGSATMIMQTDGSYQGYRLSSLSGKAIQERWDPIR